MRGILDSCLKKLLVLRNIKTGPARYCGLKKGLRLKRDEGGSIRSGAGIVTESSAEKRKVKGAFFRFEEHAHGGWKRVRQGVSVCNEDIGLGDGGT